MSDKPKVEAVEKKDPVEKPKAPYEGELKFLAELRQGLEREVLLHHGRLGAKQAGRHAKMFSDQIARQVAVQLGVPPKDYLACFGKV